MNQDEIRAMLSKDIEYYRAKDENYKSMHLSEAADYAKKLAANIELALTTLPSESDPEIY